MEAGDIPAWFTPARMLIIFCTINMLNYIDRGAIASNGVNGQAPQKDCPPDADRACFEGSGIQGDFGLSNFEDGLLPAAFMVGLLVASPLFAEGAKFYPAFRLIGIGLSVWTLAVFGCAFSTGLWTLFICRMLVGVGEASFVNLAAPFIADCAPPPRRISWLAAFYLCIPTGYALGYMLGAVVPAQFNTWRAAFVAEALCMAPFAVFGFVSRPIPLRGHEGGHHVSSDSPLPTTQTEDKKESWKIQSVKKTASQISAGIQAAANSLWVDVQILASCKAYVVNVAGYSAYTFVIGAYAFWGPKAAKLLFNMENADIVFGGVTVLSGIGGTVFGGFVLDWMGGDVEHAFKLMGAVTLGGAVFNAAAFLAPSTASFIPLLAAGEFLVFAIQGPANIVTLQSVPTALRPLAIALSTVTVHLLGDVPSPPVLGAIQDWVNNWRISMGVFTAILIPAALLWASGASISAPEQLSSSSAFCAAPETTRPAGNSELQTAPLLPESSTSSL